MFLILVSPEEDTEILETLKEWNITYTEFPELAKGDFKVAVVNKNKATFGFLKET